jgi:hypothetical protein
LRVATTPADQVGVLADGLLDPAPAQVAGHVEDGREALVDAEAAHGDADVRGHPLHEVRVEARAPGQRRGEDGRLPGRQAGEGLLVHDRRDAEAAGRDDLPLQVGYPPGAGEGLDRHGAVDPGHLAQPVADQLRPVDRVGRLVALVRGHLAGRLVDVEPGAVHLRDLLAQ